MLETSLGKDGGVFCADESLVSERADVFAHCVDTHLCRCTDGFVAGPALMGTPICTAEQVGVHRELSRR